MPIPTNPFKSIHIVFEVVITNFASPFTNLFVSISPFMDLIRCLLVMLFIYMSSAN